MLALHELNNVAQIIAVHVQMFLWTRQRQAASSVRREVTQIPAFDEAAKSRNPRVLLERAKRGNPKLTLVFKLHHLSLPAFLLVFTSLDGVDETEQVELRVAFVINLVTLAFPFPRNASAFLQYQEGKWSTRDWWFRRWRKRSRVT